MKGRLVAVLFAGLLMSPFICWIGWNMVLNHFQYRGRISDSELTKIFDSNRDTFERLSEIPQGDSQFKILLSSMKSLPEIESYPDGDIDFCFGSGGMGPLGVDWTEGIRYVAGDPKQDGVLIIRNLDQAVADDRYTYLRPLDHRWYLFFECD